MDRIPWESDGSGCRALRPAVKVLLVSSPATDHEEGPRPLGRGPGWSPWCTGSEEDPH